MRSEAGTYAVIFQCLSKATQQVGKWGMISLKEGYYIYVGSAFGPGGVKARVSHHIRSTTKPNWHIDYLRSFMRPVTVWHTYDRRRLEHRWAKGFFKMNDMLSFQGFGCSDCDCYSHLFFTSKKPQPAGFFNALAGDIEIESFQGISSHGNQRSPEGTVVRTTENVYIGPDIGVVNLPPPFHDNFRSGTHLT
jgi:Uri superfamily endonuclease